MSAFANMVESLTNPEPSTQFITKKEFYDWYSSIFVFEKLKGFTLAQAFINHFKVKDGLLQLALSDDMIKMYIENNYLK
jgi:hypothetical protein